MKNYFNLLLLVIVAFTMNVYGATTTTNSVTAPASSDLTVTTTTSTNQIDMIRKVRFQGKKVHNAYNDNTTGTAQTLQDHTASFVRLTGSGLVSIAGIPAGNLGDTRTVINQTGADITVLNESASATAALRIVTGNGKDLKVANNAAFQIMYDTVTARWHAISGAGAGGAGLGTTDTIHVQNFEDVSGSADFNTWSLAALETIVPIHDEKSIYLTPTVGADSYFGESVPVDLKFRGRNVTLKFTSDSLGANATLDVGCSTLGDILDNETLAIESVLDEYYVSFDIPLTCTDLLYEFRALAGSSITNFDDIEIYVTKFDSPTSALVQEANSYIALNTYAGYGSTANKIPRFTNSEIKGDAFTYATDSVNGMSVTINKDGVYTFNFSSEGPASNYMGVGITKNATDLTAAIYGITDFTKRLNVSYSPQVTGAAGMPTVSWTGPLVAGDVIRAHTDGAIPSNAHRFQFSGAYQGSIKQVKVNKNSKITIPTSEVRFEGASALGTGDGGFRVNLDTVAKLKGDAFIVTDDSTGSSVTMKKSGIVSVTAMFLNGAGGSQSCYIKKSSTTPYMSGQGAAASNFCGVTWTGEVIAGDILSIVTSPAPVANTSNSFNVTFQEQEVQVSVANTLPQYSESDSSVRVDTVSGYGSTASNKIRRWGSVRDNLGADITYTDSVTDGGSFRINTDGIYSISYTDNFNASSRIAITKNQSNLTLGVGGNPSDQVLRMGQTTVAGSATASWQGYLAKNDVIRASTDGTATGSDSNLAGFTISKVGKPNVTGVDVTPFVVVPQAKITKMQSAGPITITTGSKGTTSVDRVSWARRGDMAIIQYQYEQSTAGSNGTGTYGFKLPAGLVIDTAKLAISGSSYNRVVGSGHFTTSGDGRDVVVHVQDSTTLILSYANGSNQFISAGASWGFGSFSFLVFGFQVEVPIAGWEAYDDQIVTPTESFSSDTATFTYANAATIGSTAALANAPVGTYITHTFTASTVNTKVQTTGTNRPSQTDAAMNASGIYMEGRPYSSTGNFTAPPYVMIQIGKGYKNVVIDVYQNANKSGEKLSTGIYFSGSVHTGFIVTGMEAYNPQTGILTLDVGSVFSSAVSSRGFMRESTNFNLGGYVVINASKTPAMSGISYASPLVAWLKDVRTSGTQGGASIAGTQTRVLNTEDDPAGFVTLASNQFTLPAGEYIIEASAPAFISAAHKIRLRNVTDSTTTLVGTSVYNSNAAGYAQTLSEMDGRFVITGTKTFEIQHYTQIAAATNGLGVMTNNGDVETYTTVKITKVR